MLWEPCPRGDGWWSARLYRDEGVAPTGDAPHIVGALPSGRWVVVCEDFRDEGVAPTGQCPACLGAPPSGRWVVVCEGFRDEGVAPRGNALNVGHLQARQGAAPTTTVTMRSGCKTRAMAR